MAHSIWLDGAIDVRLHHLLLGEISHDAVLRVTAAVTVVPQAGPDATGLGPLGQRSEDFVLDLSELVSRERSDVEFRCVRHVMFLPVSYFILECLPQDRMSTLVNKNSAVLGTHFFDLPDARTLLTEAPL